jgi:hypothetical protein
MVQNHEKHNQKSSSNMVKHHQKHDQTSSKNMVKNHQNTWSQIIKTWSEIVEDDTAQNHYELQWLLEMMLRTDMN